jgi:hypothetical protein
MHKHTPNALAAVTAVLAAGNLAPDATAVSHEPAPQTAAAVSLLSNPEAPLKANSAAAVVSHAHTDELARNHAPAPQYVKSTKGEQLRKAVPQKAGHVITEGLVEAVSQQGHNKRYRVTPHSTGHGINPDLAAAYTASRNNKASSYAVQTGGTHIIMEEKVPRAFITKGNRLKRVIAELVKANNDGHTTAQSHDVQVTPQAISARSQLDVTLDTKNNTQ